MGIAPRRNPDIVVAVLWEHGNWGNNSAKLAAQVINAYVTKQRAQAGNLMKLADSNKSPAPTPLSTPATTPPAIDDRAARPAGGADALLCRENLHSLNLEFVDKKLRSFRHQRLGNLAVYVSIAASLVVESIEYAVDPGTPFSRRTR